MKPLTVSNAGDSEIDGFRLEQAWQCDVCAKIVRAETCGMMYITKIQANAQIDSCDRDSGRHIWMPIDDWQDVEPIYKPGVKYVPTFQDPGKPKLSQEKLREYMVEIMKLAKNMGATVLVDSFGSQVQEQKPEPKPEAPKLRRFNWEDA